MWADGSIPYQIVQQKNIFQSVHILFQFLRVVYWQMHFSYLIGLTMENRYCSNCNWSLHIPTLYCLVFHGNVAVLFNYLGGTGSYFIMTFTIAEPPDGLLWRSLGCCLIILHCHCSFLDSVCKLENISANPWWIIIGYTQKSLRRAALKPS